MNKKTISIGVLVLVVLGIAVFAMMSHSANPPATTTGKPKPQADVVVTSPLSSATIHSPITIKGKAKGTYYFEASFPVKIKDAAGNIVGEGVAQAQSDWMTTDYVPFVAKITFTAQKPGTQGTIVFKNDNPSGDPVRDKFVVLPIKF